MFYFKDFILQSISKTRFAPVSEVVFEVSYAGDTSTRSQPTMLRPLHPIRTIFVFIPMQKKTAGLHVLGSLKLSKTKTIDDQSVSETDLV